MLADGALEVLHQGLEIVDVQLEVVRHPRGGLGLVQRIGEDLALPLRLAYFVTVS